MCLVDSVLSGVGGRALSSLLKLDITTDVFHHIFLRFNCTCLQIFFFIATSFKIQLGPSILYGKSHQLKQTYQKLLTLYLLLFSVDFCAVPTKLVHTEVPLSWASPSTSKNEPCKYNIFFPKYILVYLCTGCGNSKRYLIMPWTGHHFPVEINTWN